MLLHFGAVDWRAEVFVNGKSVGKHEGGYDPFTFDITDALKPGSRQELAVAVWDPTDDGLQPRGKQVLNPNGIWYTAVTGIWQTAWLEPVPAAYISEIAMTPDLDGKRLRLTVRTSAPGEFTATARLRGKAVGKDRGKDQRGDVARGLRDRAVVARFSGALRSRDRAEVRRFRAELLRDAQGGFPQGQRRRQSHLPE